ncbi:MAG: AAA family ATPase, partial [Leptospiraceae bacterium]|nr:AAA family ATPase [Leptospiraceae bacterium]
HFSIEQFFSISLELTKILGKSHKKNIIHKNINPRNILFNAKTNELRLIDFGISSELSREKQSLNVTERLEGSLPYISPEQTGRMNRELDYRADYYSLGVTLFEILTGQLPFQAKDIMGWVYCHISKEPQKPSELNPEIPEMIEAIILKLMAKNAEDRYQSSYGLLKDLEECQQQYLRTTNIETFPLGRYDISEKLQITQKLYGRETEVQFLLKTFEKVANGNSELLLISGYSGVGKSVLVYEVHKLLVKERGYFIEGKFDQFKGNRPYEAIAQAFRHLAHQLLTESKEELNAWKEKLLQSFGPNGQIVLDMIPDFELIIGKQPPLQELGVTESQNRFKIVFRNFIKVFANAEHPLVLFLDDLQWSDLPTLNLLRHWMESEDLSYLLILAAYRDNEVGPVHPMSLALDEIKKVREIHTLLLKPLNEDNVIQIVSDTFWTDRKVCIDLGKLLYQKTDGNPFFVGKLFRKLYAEESIWFNIEKGCWEWNLEEIRKIESSSNVVEFMIEALRKFPLATQRVLQLAACIGNIFDLKTLSLIYERTLEETDLDLFVALKSGLVSPLSEDYKFITPNIGSRNPEYKFQHDRVQQAAYSLIEESQQQEVHLTIGRLMLKSLDESEQEEKLLDILRHLNEGRKLIKKDSEKENLAYLNLKAGIKARDAAAYQPALEYIKIAREVLSENPWETKYNLILAISKEYCQCAYLTGKIEEAESQIELMLSKVKTNFERVEIYYLRQSYYLVLSKIEESIQVGMKSLSLLGIEIPLNPNPLSIFLEFLLVKRNLGKKKISDLINQDEMIDAEKRLVIRTMSEMAPAIYNMGNENLVVLLSLKMLNLSLRFGNSTYSSYSYFVYGNFLTNYSGNPKDGYEFGKLAVALNEKYRDKSFEPRTLFTYNFFIRPWNEYWKELTPGFQKAIESAYQSGDMFYLAYSSILLYTWNPGINLKEKLQYLSKSIAICKSTNFDVAIDSSFITYQTNLNYCGLTNDRFSMNTDSFDEIECMERMRQRNDISGITYYHFFKSDILFLYEEYGESLNYIIEAEKYENAIKGCPTEARLCTISFFTCMALYKKAKLMEKRKLKKRIQKRYKQMKKWADHCPINFLHLRLAMDAELTSLSNKPLKAAKLYREAAEKAREGEWQQDEGMILMLAGNFYKQIGLEVEASSYISKAYLVYENWGASRKLEFLRENYSDLLNQNKFEERIDEYNSCSTNTLLASKERSFNTFISGDEINLDVATISKAAQTLSGEVVLEKLLQKLMDTVCENAGAEKGFLLLVESSGERMFIQAERKENGETILLSGHSVEDNKSLCLGIVNYVERSKEEVVLADACREGNFTEDPYIQAKNIKSLLCTTILSQKRFLGILYLENNKISAAFTPKRLEVLRIISSQAAISIENAFLYENLEKKVEDRTRELSVALKKVEEERMESEKLLLNILPKEVAKELKEHGYAEPVYYESVSVMFTDFKGFTKIAEKMSPEDLIQELDASFYFFDDVVKKYNLEKIKTIGDSYMCAGGLPLKNKTYAIDACLAALEIQSIMNQTRELKMEMGLPYWELRLGIHVGPVVAGVVGKHKFSYDIWGDTVNTASRMESNGVAGKINISEAAYNLVKDYFDCEYRGKVKVKGKGEVEMYYVNGLKQEYMKGKSGVIPNDLFWSKYKVI